MEVLKNLVEKFKSDSQEVKTEEAVKLPVTVKELDTKTNEVISIGSFDYYKRFFDVTTAEVLTRAVSSTIPKPRLDRYHLIRLNPDLYGPVWISVTLVITINVSGNMSRYFSLQTNEDWRYEFNMISVAATCVLSYSWLWPLIIWTALKWNMGNSIRISYTELVCVYGYSISVFIPISILWMVKLLWMQLCLSILGSMLSGAVLLRSVLLSLPTDACKYGSFVLLSHLALPFCLQWFCFRN